jgi:hypothetical protein
MGFGVGIFLIAAGAIMAFAIKVRPWWIDLYAAGLVVMLAGGAVLVISAWVWHSGRPPPWERYELPRHPAAPYPPVTEEPPANPPAE